MTSPFVTALVRRIKRPSVEINKVFRLVADDVYAESNGTQKPAFYSALSGDDLYFLPPLQTSNA